MVVDWNNDEERGDDVSDVLLDCEDVVDVVVSSVVR